MSTNGIESCGKVNEALRSFLKHIMALRVLDLSYYKVSIDSAKVMELELLETKHLLMLPLAGNNLTANHSRTLELVPMKLRRNRLITRRNSWWRLS